MLAMLAMLAVQAVDLYTRTTPSPSFMRVRVFSLLSLLRNTIILNASLGIWSSNKAVGSTQSEST